MYRLKIDGKLHTMKKHSGLSLCTYTGMTLGSLETTVFPLLQALFQGDAGLPRAGGGLLKDARGKPSLAWKIGL